MQLETILYSPYFYAATVATGLGVWGWVAWGQLEEDARAAVKTTAIIATIACAGVGYAAYQYGATAHTASYRFLSYIDGQTIEIAKDMQAMCDQRNICKAADIQTRWEDATGVGKIAAKLR